MKIKKLGAPKLGTPKLVHGVGNSDANYVVQTQEQLM